MVIEIKSCVSCSCCKSVWLKLADALLRYLFYDRQACE